MGPGNQPGRRINTPGTNGKEFFSTDSSPEQTRATAITETSLGVVGRAVPAQCSFVENIDLVPVNFGSSPKMAAGFSALRAMTGENRAQASLHLEVDPTTQASARSNEFGHRTARRRPDRRPARAAPLAAWGSRYF